MKDAERLADRAVRLAQDRLSGVTEERPIERAVRLAGGQAELARLCNTSQPRIWQCLHRNLTVPAELVLPIERAVSGAVTRYELRPDLYPVE